mmetsp:Transcript_14386/g.30950  ORF Transcript_14386/g.30950 Transcript_14386/m.30950 type:complete len:317 (-) Transcript_14386:383-1333(-)
MDLTPPLDNSSACCDANARSMSTNGMTPFVPGAGAGVVNRFTVTADIFHVSSGTDRISSTNLDRSLPSRSAEYTDAAFLPCTPIKTSKRSDTDLSARALSRSDTHFSLFRSALSGIGRPPHMPYSKSVLVRRIKSKLPVPSPPPGYVSMVCPGVVISIIPRGSMSLFLQYFSIAARALFSRSAPVTNRNRLPTASPVVVSTSLVETALLPVSASMHSVRRWSTLLRPTRASSNHGSSGSMLSSSAVMPGNITSVRYFANLVMLVESSGSSIRLLLAVLPALVVVEPRSPRRRFHFVLRVKYRSWTDRTVTVAGGGT